MLQVGQKAAEHGGSQQHAADELPHDRGLADTLHELADQSAAGYQGNDFAKEDGERGLLPGAPSRQRRCGCDGCYEQEQDTDWEFCKDHPRHYRRRRCTAAISGSSFDRIMRARRGDGRGAAEPR